MFGAGNKYRPILCKLLVTGAKLTASLQARINALPTAVIKALIAWRISAKKKHLSMVAGRKKRRIAGRVPCRLGRTAESRNFKRTAANVSPFTFHTFIIAR